MVIEGNVITLPDGTRIILDDERIDIVLSSGANINIQNEDPIEDRLISGDLIPALSQDLTAKITTPQEVGGSFAIRTTGGDIDVKDGLAYLYNLRGNLDENKNPFLADSLVSTGENLINPDSVFTATINNSNKLVSGSNKVVYFPVAAGKWGEYQTTQENNGYIIAGATPITVAYKSTLPAMNDNLESIPSHQQGNNVYYLPEDGWLLIEFASSVNLANVSCHVAWSNTHDSNIATFGNNSIDLTQVISWIHAWGMAGINKAGQHVYDEIIFGESIITCWRRIERLKLNTLTWTKTEQVIPSTDQESGQSQDITIYHYTAPVSLIRPNGLFDSTIEDLQLENNTLSFDSKTITSVNSLLSYFGEAYLYYELATYASNTSLTVDREYTVNDYGLEYFMNGSQIASVKALVTTAYYQKSKDMLFNNVTYVKILAEVLAAALSQLNERVLTLEQKLESADLLRAKNLIVERQIVSPK